MPDLKDIRTLEEIGDNSLILFIIMIAFALLFLGALIFMIRRFLKSKHKDLIRKEVLDRLHHIDFEDPKKAAYKITKYARYLAHDERSKKILHSLEEKLSSYKYIPNPPAFDKDTMGEYALFLEVVDG